MKLSTPVPVHPQDLKIDHHSKVFLMGSCFVENIGEKLDYYKFQNLPLMCFIIMNAGIVLQPIRF